ncbi:hypothetical protein [Cellulosimicrobium sp. NPDC057127]|uniref:hypothetical protein n=1 Tax=Cellulosimicrobium sp. NPDC057127 TaxID=3346026 RepID=UPI003626EB08
MTDETYAPIEPGPGHAAFCGLLDPHLRHRHADDTYSVCDGVKRRRRTPEWLDRAREGERATGDDGIALVKGPYDLWYQLDSEGQRSGIGVPSYAVWAAPAPAPTVQEIAAQAVARFFHASMGGSEQDVPAPTVGDVAIAGDVVIALRVAGHLKAAPNT